MYNKQHSQTIVFEIYEHTRITIGKWYNAIELIITKFEPKISFEKLG